MATAGQIYQMLCGKPHNSGLAAPETSVTAPFRMRDKKNDPKKVCNFIGLPARTGMRKLLGSLQWAIDYSISTANSGAGLVHRPAI